MAAPMRAPGLECRSLEGGVGRSWGVGGEAVRRTGEAKGQTMVAVENLHWPLEN